MEDEPPNLKNNSDQSSGDQPQNLYSAPLPTAQPQDTQQQQSSEPPGAGAYFNSIASDLEKQRDPNAAIQVENEHLQNPDRSTINGITPTAKTFMVLFVIGFIAVELLGVAHSKSPNAGLLVLFLVALAAQVALISYYGFIKREICLGLPGRYSSARTTYFGKKAVNMGIINLATVIAFAAIAFYYYKL